MRKNLVKYSLAVLISLSAFLYAGPDYSLINLTRAVSPSDNNSSSMMIRKQESRPARKLSPHQLSPKKINSLPPVQRCIKALKI